MQLAARVCSSRRLADGYHGGRSVDGMVVEPGSTASNSISAITHLAALSHKKLFGAWYGVEFLQAFAHVNAGAQGKVIGFGQLTVSPLILQWNEQRIGTVRWTQRVVLDFDLRTGQYQRAAKLNLGNNAVDVQPYYALTVFPGKHWESSWRVHYLWSATNNAPTEASNAHCTQAGQAMHFNGTVGYRLVRGVWIGANGYYLTQVTDPRVNGQALGNSGERIGAVGPGAVWDMGHWLLFANAYRELGAINRPEGNKVILRVQWLPSRKGSTADQK